MKSQRVLDQSEVAHILAAAFSYNRLNCVDIAFDISDGTLKVICTVEEEPLTVRESPDDAGGFVMDQMSKDMLHKMQQRANNNVGNTGK